MLSLFGSCLFPLSSIQPVTSHWCDLQDRNTLAKARANNPRKQPRHDVCDGAASWHCGMDAGEEAWRLKPTAKRKAPLGCIDHAYTHDGMPVGPAITTDGQAGTKLSEAALVLEEVRELFTRFSR